jgi:hypothetical protein
VEEAKSHQSVDWWAYFKSIRTQCPWSYVAYNKGLIDIVTYSGVTVPLGLYEARMYVVNVPNATVESLAAGLDYSDTECEWLYSYPGYGEYATPVSVLIQQNRRVLNDLRKHL